MQFAKVLLIINGLLLAGYGAVCFISPEVPATLMGVELGNAGGPVVRDPVSQPPAVIRTENNRMQLDASRALEGIIMWLLCCFAGTAPTPGGLVMEGCVRSPRNTPIRSMGQFECRLR